VDAAITRLGALRIELSRPFLQSRQNVPVLDVWFEPGMGLQGVQAGALPIGVIHGRLQLEPQVLVWSHLATAPLATIGIALNLILGVGGRVVIRFHCGLLLDEQRRPFSATLQAINGFAGPRLPGGVFESWFLVTPGRVPVPLPVPEPIPVPIPGPSPFEPAGPEPAAPARPRPRRRRRSGS
jgi:hypothetical protein